MPESREDQITSDTALTMPGSGSAPVQDKEVVEIENAPKPSVEFAPANNNVVSEPLPVTGTE